MTQFQRAPDQIINVPRDKITALEHWFNTAREGLSEDHWKELARSIADKGVQQHPRAYLDDSTSLWVPVFGHHRFAAMLFGLKWEIIPFVPLSGKPTEAQIRELQWLENNSQLSMKPMEKARAAIGIRDANGETNVETAKRLGIKSVSFLTDWDNWINVLGKEMQDALDEGRIGESVASWLARCADVAVREELFQRAVAKKITRDQLVEAVQEANGKPGKGDKPERVTIRVGKGTAFRIDGEDFDLAKSQLATLARLIGKASSFPEFRDNLK